MGYFKLRSRAKRGDTYIFNRKYQEIPKKFRKYLEMNTLKYYEIPGNT
jgi:hypothetical protein